MSTITISHATLTSCSKNSPSFQSREPRRVSLKVNPLSSFRLKKTVNAVETKRALISASSTTAPSVEKIEWRVKRQTLLKNNVKSYDAAKVAELVKQDYVVLDVRPTFEYEEMHAEGSKNAQIYRLIKNWTAWDNLRRAGFAFFGVFTGTEENPEFLQELEASGLTKDSKIIVACATGGTMKPSQNFPEGKQSRSLIAAYQLVQAGYKSIYHLEGGLNSWFGSGFPVQGKSE